MMTQTPRVGVSDFARSLATSMNTALRCQMLSNATKIRWCDVRWLIQAGATDLVQ
jgi:hypothetical protein